MVYLMAEWKREGSEFRYRNDFTLAQLKFANRFIIKYGYNGIWLKVCVYVIHSYERSMNWRKYKAIIVIARYLIKMEKKQIFYSSHHEISILSSLHGDLQLVGDSTSNDSRKNLSKFESNGGAAF